MPMQADVEPVGAHELPSESPRALSGCMGGGIDRWAFAIDMSDDAHLSLLPEIG